MHKEGDVIALVGFLLIVVSAVFGGLSTTGAVLGSGAASPIINIILLSCGLTFLWIGFQQKK